MLLVTREDNHLDYVRTFEDARQLIEDDAVTTWDRLRDPNNPDAQVYPGLEWSINGEDDAFAWLHVGTKGGLIEYSVIDPTPFATWGAINAGVLEPPLADAICIVYDNKGCDYPHSQELLIWLV